MGVGQIKLQRKSVPMVGPDYLPPVPLHLHMGTLAPGKGHTIDGDGVLQQGLGKCQWLKPALGPVFPEQKGAVVEACSMFGGWRGDDVEE